MVPSLPSRAEDERGDGLMQKPVYEHLDGSGVEDLGPGSFRSCAEGTAHGIGMEGGGVPRQARDEDFGCEPEATAVNSQPLSSHEKKAAASSAMCPESTLDL